MNTVHVTLTDDTVKTYYHVDDVHVRLEWKALYIYQNDKIWSFDLDDIKSIVIKEEIK